MKTIWIDRRIEYKRAKTKSRITIIGTILINCLFILLAFGSGESSQTPEFISKDENLLSIDEWKKKADYRAQEFYECTKDLDMDITKHYLFESCARDYNNNWVRFRDGLDERSNLNYEQREMLKDYWHKTRDAMTEKVVIKMEENENKLRPNRNK